MSAEDSQSTPSLDPDVNEEELSLFDIHMPGILTLDEVKALDLDHWYLLFHGSFVHMIVSPCPRPITLFSFANQPRIWSVGRICPWTIPSP